MIRLITATCLITAAHGTALAAGTHSGEAPKITASVAFKNPAGVTVTDAAGIRYTMNGWTFDSESKVYPQKYWGSFPLYFVGTTMKFTVTVVNTAPSGEKKFKVRVQALNNVLETSGAAGFQLAPPQEWLIQDLRPGETRQFEGSVFIKPDPNLPSGLDLTRIRISHINEGANVDAALIKEEVAVWCPPPAKEPVK